MAPRDASTAEKSNGLDSNFIFGLESNSNISNFFCQRSVFITGATGFVGKGILEKLLRACPEVDKIYILLRQKRGVDVQARLAKLLTSSLFETVLAKTPEIMTKIVPISGDLALECLGISNEDEQLLFEKVSVVINSAATVKFDEKLKLAFSVNTMGTKRLIDFCKQIKELKTLVHVSTAYANCNESTIEETVYPVTVDPGKLASCLEWMSDEIIDSITPTLIRPKPNTYTFTKALAEYLLKGASADLPITIVRPSIVVATWREPIPGWVDNFNSATGPIAGNGAGVLRTLPCDTRKMTDISPLDLTVNLILAAAWKCGVTERSKGIEVFNCCSGNGNPLSWGTIGNSSTKYMLENPLSSAVWVPNLQLESSPTLYAIQNFLWHYLPTHFLYLVSLISGKPKGMKKLYQDIRNSTILRHFTTHDWKFDTSNVEALYAQMSPIDQEVFNFNIKDVDWPSFISNYCLGIRKHLFKEDLSTLPAARKRMKRLQCFRNFLRISLILTAAWTFLRYTGRRFK